MWRGALLLLTAIAAHHEPASGGDADVMRLLDGTVWIDIGLGRDVATLTPRQIAELRRCKDPTMAFQKEAGRWVQSFYAGIEMRTLYSSAALKNDSAGKTVLFYAADTRIPAETLHLAGNVLVEQTRGFRPRTFLKCNQPEPPPRKH
jgi:hypothetical protein